ncbi:hypothetical protein SUDANB105_07632 [Streptomyces sp. enrichment culture]
MAGLRPAPAAFVATSADDLRQTDLAQWGLARGDLLAVNPAGDRLVISYRHRLVTVGQGLEGALGVAAVPEDFGGIRDMVFCGPDRLLTSGDAGSLLVWGLHSQQPSVTAAHRGPALRNLFALPAWGAVGGTDHREHRLRFHDPHTLRPVPPPVPLRAVAEHLDLVLSSADGRYVAYGGQLGLAAGHRRYTVGRERGRRGTERAGRGLPGCRRAGRAEEEGTIPGRGTWDSTLPGPRPRWGELVLGEQLLEGGPAALIGTRSSPFAAQLVSGCFPGGRR